MVNKENMADESVFFGTWKIVECVSLAENVESTGIEGTVFTLDESGDVSWKVSEDAEPLPFFSCETYEVTMGDSDPAVLKFFGTFASHFIEFKVEVSDDLMLLTYERCCMLQCQKVSTYDPKDEEPFSFSNALQEGYFTDLIIRANTAKEFRCHKCIVQLSAPDLDWDRSPTPLTGLPEDVVSTLLHYMYAECLPKGVSEETVRNCVKAVEKLKGFKDFAHLCETFLKNTALKHQMESLVNDMHACGDRIIDLFCGKVSMSGDPATPLTDQSLMANPAKVCYVVKQALREAAVAGAKLLLLCELFARRKGELSREERHNIIKYAKSRLPVFMSQLKRFLEVCKQHTNALTAAQRLDLATYLVPEIEHSMETLSTLTAEVKSALEHVISISSAEKEGKSDKHKKSGGGGQVAEVLGKSLRNALHMREILKLKNFHEKMSSSFQNFMQKKEQFSQMTGEEKVRSVSKNMEQMIDEVPMFLTKIEDLMSALDEKVTWREWKYLFKLGTSKIAWVLGKLQAHCSTVSSLISETCNMVHRDQFTQSMAMLGLTTATQSQPTASTTGQPATTGIQTPQTYSGANISGHGMMASNVFTTVKFSSSVQNPTSLGATASVAVKQPSTITKYVQLSSIESLCEPPYARDSGLARRALELLHSAEYTDMVFEILTVQESGDVVIDHTHGEPISRTDHQKEVDIYTIPAHCVIVASRCDWFRRALLSGMRESIDKRISIHDTSAVIFRQFLEYLYSGELELDNLSTDQLSDLLTLTDRYELDSLKSLCQHSLKHHVDEESCLILLSLADQYNAPKLREFVLNFIMEHRDVMESEVFQQLPRQLQEEIDSIVTWQSLDPHMQSLSLQPHTDTPSSNSSDQDLAASGGFQLAGSSSSSLEETLHYMEDRERLQSCIQQLRDIVGEEYPQEELAEVALAADCDTNRALNYLFSAQG